MNGKNGIELAKKHKPEVILLVLAMPIMDGIEVDRVLKYYFKTRSSAIIFLTAMPKKYSRIEVLVEEVEVVKKTFNIMLLIDRISKIYNKPQYDRSATF